MEEHIDECYETYTMMPDRRALLVRYTGDRYIALLVDKELVPLGKINIYGNCTIMEATTKALEEFEIEANITTLLLKESIIERDTELVATIDDELIERLRSVSTEAMTKLIDDDSIDETTREAMKMVLRERSDDQ